MHVVLLPYKDKDKINVYKENIVSKYKAFLIRSLV